MRTSKEEMEEAIRPAGVSIATRRGEVFLKGNPGGEGENLENSQERLGERGVFRYPLSIPEIAAEVVSGLGISKESIYS